MKSAIRYTFVTMILPCRPMALGNHGRLALLCTALGFLTLPVAAQSVYVTPYTISTLAGFSPVGSADGVGSDARFNLPFGAAVDSAGNLYVADVFSATIRKVTPEGVVTTLAGVAGSSGANDGTGSAAQFAGPSGVAVDSAGNVYVADTWNHTIRKVTPNGTNWVVTTLAGLADAKGSADGTNNAARFNNPSGVAVDSAGNLYVADTYNNTIRKVTALGTNWVVTTLAGLAGSPGSADRTGTNALFNGPTGLAVDSAGILYVADQYNNTIRKVTPLGVVTTLAGLAGSSGTNDGTGTKALFNGPTGVAVDSATNLYVADQNNNTIRKVTPAGKNWVVKTVAGLGGKSGGADGTGSDARFNSPCGVAVDSAGNLYVADTYNSIIRKINAAGVVNTLAGPDGGGQGSLDGTGTTARFWDPLGVAVDSAGNVYVADTVNCTIRTINSVGVVSTLAGLAMKDGSADGVGSDARFKWPSGVALDSAGNLYVADTGNSTIRKVTPLGVVTTLAGLAGRSGTNDGTGTKALFNGPAGVAVDSAGNLYVADQTNNTIRKVTAAGVVTTLAGLPQFDVHTRVPIGGSADGTNSAARFDGPRGVAVDSAGNLYVADWSNSTIRKVTPVGTNWKVTTLAGLAGNWDSADGTNSDARFFLPVGVAVDTNANVYVADTYNMTIRKVTPVGTNWVVTTLAGLAGVRGSADATGSDARFFLPSGLAADSAGNLYVADQLNNTIRKGVLTPYSRAQPVAYTPPLMNGQLRLTLLPPEANGQWRFPWELGWRDSGTVATNLVADTYSVELRSRPGWLVLPSGLNVAVTGSGTDSITTNVYYPTISYVDTNTTGGALTVDLGPNPPAEAGWRFLGDTTPFLHSGYTTNLLPGTYLIEFAGPFAHRSTPSDLSVEVFAGQPTVISVDYLVAQSPPAGVELPRAVLLSTSAI